MQASLLPADEPTTRTSRVSEADPLAIEEAIRQVTWVGLVVNLLLAGAKFLAGTLAGSRALVADAVHSLSDLVTDVVVLVGAGMWTVPADAGHPHGHGRIETVVSAAIGFALGAAGIGLAWSALVALHQGVASSPGWLAFWMGCVSVVTKEWLFRWTFRVGKRYRSSALLANAWHHRSDALSSIPVAVAVAGSRLHPEWHFLDHVAAILVSMLILYVAWTIIVPAIAQLTDAGLSEEEVERLVQLVLQTEGVRATHEIRSRYIGTKLQVDLHILVDPQLTVREGHRIAAAVRDRLLEEVENLADVLVHVEPFEPQEIKAGTRFP
jgi:cation diffusion facilitator family transporter